MTSALLQYVLVTNQIEHKFLQRLLQLSLNFGYQIGAKLQKNSSKVKHIEIINITVCIELF